MSDLEGACRTLALAWYFTGEEKFAAKASALLRHWFFEEATRMNPNLNYAQAVPGVNDGRGTGIIESIALTGIADAAGFAGRVALMDAGGCRIAAAMVCAIPWTGCWTSKNGKDEHAAPEQSWHLVPGAGD